MPVQPPVQNTWKWVTVNVATDEGELFAFFQANAGGNGLWQAGGGNHTMGDRKVPYILALPGVLLEYIHAQGVNAGHMNSYGKLGDSKGNTRSQLRIGSWWRIGAL